MTSASPLRLGVAGLGRAFQLMAPGLMRHPKIRLVAAADPRPEARANFIRDYSARAYESVDALCADDAVEAVYVATPHEFHAANVRCAARHRKHVLVEKPMALTLEDCRAMIAETRDAGVQLVVGHSHSFDLPVQRTRELVASRQYGELRMLTAANFTDFLFRPRRPEELDTRRGGGVFFNQAPHQVDVARLIAASRVVAVRAIAGAWDTSRPTEGAYSSLLRFESGAFASITYSGYAHFDTDEFMGWIAESGMRKHADEYGSARARLRRAKSPEDELAIKYAERGEKPDNGTEQNSGRLHQHFGLVIASCDHADLRPLPDGVAIYGDEVRRFDPMPPPGIHRSGVLDEFCAAAMDGRPAFHDGAWAMATIQVCLAMLQSAREQREVILQEEG